MLFVFKVAGVFYPFDFVLEGALGLQGEIIKERPGLGQLSRNKERGNAQGTHWECRGNNQISNQGYKIRIKDKGGNTRECTRDRK